MALCDAVASLVAVLLLDDLSAKTKEDAASALASVPALIDAFLVAETATEEL